MTVCGDVYTRPQSCDAIWIYPSQVHPPTPGGRVRPSGPQVSHTRGKPIPRHPRQLVLPDDDDVAIALALLNL